MKARIGDEEEYTGTNVLTKDPPNVMNDFLGNEDTRKQMGEIYFQISKSEIFKRMGVKPDRSFMFYGDSGTGKTLAVKCLWGELCMNGISSLIMEYEIGKYGTAYINRGSRVLQAFFDEGRGFLHNPNFRSGKILYVFDEAEVLMGKRGSDRSGHKEDDKLLNTLMINLQRISDSNDEAYVFFMTNKIDLIDPASMRSGRVERRVEFRKPDYVARYELFGRAISSINKKAKYQIFRDFDLEELARMSEGFNCADCVEIPSRAVKKRVHDILQSRLADVIRKGCVTQKRLVEEIQEQRDAYYKTEKRKIGLV